MECSTWYVLFFHIELWGVFLSIISHATSLLSAKNPSQKQPPPDKWQTHTWSHMHQYDKQTEGEGSWLHFTKQAGDY